MHACVLALFGRILLNNKSTRRITEAYNIHSLRAIRYNRFPTWRHNHSQSASANKRMNPTGNEQHNNRRRQEPLQQPETQAALIGALRDQMIHIISSAMTGQETAAFFSALQIMRDQQFASNIPIDAANDHMRNHLETFLRADNYQPGLAAHRICQYHNHIHTLFGETHLGRNPTVESLSETEHSILLSGCIKFVQQTNADRPGVSDIICIDEKIASRWPIQNLLKVLVLVAFSASQNASIREVGVVFVSCRVGDSESTDPTMTRQCEAFLRYAAPIKVTAFHVWTDNPNFAAILQNSRHSIQSATPDMVVHTTVASLREYGIEPTALALPSTVDMEELRLQPARSSLSNLAQVAAAASLPGAGAITASPSAAASSRSSTPAGGRLSLPISLSLKSDEHVLSAFQTYLRQQIEVFEAGREEIDHNATKVKRKIVKGQIGLRCIHCSMDPIWRRDAGFAYYPRGLESFYQVGQNLAKNHILDLCHKVPAGVRERLKTLRSERSRAPGGKEYWVEAAAKLGLSQAEEGVVRLASSSSSGGGKLPGSR